VNSCFRPEISSNFLPYTPLKSPNFQKEVGLFYFYFRIWTRPDIKEKIGC
jgi:hypothetical protein